MESRGGSGAEGGSVQVQLLRKETELRSAVEETTKACMKSRALLLQYEEPSRIYILWFLRAARVGRRCSSQVPEKCAG